MSIIKSKSGILNIIFDLGGVLILQDAPSAFRNFSKSSNIDEATLKRHFYAFFDTSSINKKIGADEFYRSNINGINADLTPKQWQDLLKTIYKSEVLNVELVRWIESHPQYHYYALTNNIVGIKNVLATKFHIAHKFTAIINSAEIGVKKPNPEVFIYILKVIGSQPEQCVFVDDNYINVQAARNLHLHGIQYRTMPEFVAEIDRISDIS